MHREIAKRAGIPYSDTYDHKDRNGLNNTRKNIRPCTDGQNMANSTKRANTSSKCKGVWKNHNKYYNKWSVEIRKDGKRKWLGNFETEEEAGKAYLAAAQKIWKEFSSGLQGF